MKKQTIIFVAVILCFSMTASLVSCEKAETEESLILKLESGDVNLTIDAEDGSQTIVKATELFAGIDDHFTEWGLNEPEPATGEISIDIYKMISDVTAVKAFTEITNDLDKIVLTQSQIIRFCQKYSDQWLTKNYGTFFLTKKRGYYFPVRVLRYNSDNYVFVYELGSGAIWGGQSRCNVAVPHF